jgi:hypothetical protein
MRSASAGTTHTAVRAQPLSLEEAVMLQVYWLVASALSGSFLVRC